MEDLNLEPLRIAATRDVHVTFSAETETRLRPRRYKLPRRLVKSSKQSPQVAAYTEILKWYQGKHVAFIIWSG